METASPIFWLTDLDRIVNCPGWYRLKKTMPARNYDDDMTERKEGILAHRLLAATFGKDIPTEEPTDEMIYGINLFHDYLKELFGKQYASIEHGVETKYQHSRLPIVGQPDLWFYDRENDVLHVFDYKFGRLFVDAEDNYQLIGGALLVLNHCRSTMHTKVICHIVQPRCYTAKKQCRSVSYVAIDMRKYYEIIDTACKNAATHLANRTGDCRVNPHCFGCSMTNVCQSFLVASSYSIYKAFSVDSSGPLDGVQAGRALKELRLAKKLIEQRLTGLEADCLHRLTDGKNVEGYILEPTFARKKWRSDYTEEIIAGILELSGATDPWKKSLKAISNFAAEVDPEIINSLTERPSSGVKLKEFNLKDIVSKFEDNL